jgi:hypothetical protein
MSGVARRAERLIYAPEPPGVVRVGGIYVNETDIARVQAYLRATLGNDRLRIAVPKKKGATVEVFVDDDFLGTLHRDDDEGEVSFSLHISILDEDLPAVAVPRRR